MTLTETDRLLKVIADLRAEGVSVIFISHRLDEVTACADRVVVLRDGQLVGRLAKAEITPAAMIRLMIGRDLKSIYVPPRTAPGGPLLEILGARTAAYPARSVDLTLRRGEILGLAGLVGAGRTELARAIFGIDPLMGGEVRLDGEPLAITSPRDAIAEGIYLVPEDRKASGVMLDLAICDNISLPQLPSLSRLGIVGRPAETRLAEGERRRLGIRAPSIDTLAGRALRRQPAEGRARQVAGDAPARHHLRRADPRHRRRRQARDSTRSCARSPTSGVAVLMISSDMEEVIGVSDRIAVMHEGAISGILERHEFSEHRVLQLAVGGE